MIQGLALVVILGLTAFSWFTLKILHVTNSISAQTYSRLQTAALSVGTLASMGSVALLKDVTIVKSLDALIKVNVSLPAQEKPPKPQPDPPSPEGPKPEPPPRVVHLYPRLDCGKDKTQRIELFAVGKHTLERDADAKLTDLIGELKKIPPDRLVGFVLIGSADKRRLRPDLARTYGSNDGLAQARVKEVQERLRGAFADNPPSFLPLHAGPSRIGSKVQDLDLAFDRAVQICVLWTPT